MNWPLILSWVAVICLALAAFGVTFKPWPRLALGWLGLAVWAFVVLLLPQT